MVQGNNNQRVKKFYVYGHYTNEGIIYYIGVGTILNLKTNKIKSKYARAYHFRNRNKYWKHVKHKHGLKVKILDEFYTKEESLDREKELIFMFKKRVDGGLLCNISDGGEIGPIGRKMPMKEAQKRLLSEIKSISIFIYSREGVFIKEMKTIKKAAEFCGVTYNAVFSCMETKNYTNGFFCFREFKGDTLGYTYKNLDFNSPLCKKVFTKNLISGEIILHKSLNACRKYLGADRANLQRCLKKTGRCKGYKVFLESTISSQAT